MSLSLPGSLVGVLLAVALCLLVSIWRHPENRPGSGGLRSGREPRLQRLLQRAGWGRLSPARFIGGCLMAAVLAGVVIFASTAVPMAGLIAAVAAGLAPVMVARRRAHQRAERVRASWPEAVDVMVSGIRAGLSLPDAVAAVAASGPEPLRPYFAAAAVEHRASGSFDAALDVLQQQAADPVADRVVVALRLARELGGTSVGEVLRTLSAMVREDARTRAEIRGRQSWTISAARMAVAAPWLVLLLLSTRPEAVASFATPAGAGVLVLAALLTLVAYLTMMRVARLPELSRLAS